MWDEKSAALIVAAHEEVMRFAQMALEGETKSNVIRKSALCRERRAQYLQQLTAGYKPFRLCVLLSSPVDSRLIT